jgi:hypothetical protein
MKTSTQDNIMFAAIIAAVLGALLIAGCALSIPVPPSGADAGKYGYIKLGYEPSVLNTPFLVTTNQPATNTYK